MANVIQKALNKFTKGLVMDFSPENTKNEVLTHALNATLLTFNGNELSLQNDMGNARVETAYLPEGYIPVGTCEYGGIIYIVSYNPLEDKSQIGCFPSPERNVSSEELGESGVNIRIIDFQKTDDGKITGEIVNSSKYALLRDKKLNPGDKFAIRANAGIYDELLQDLIKISNGTEEFVANPVIALNIVSIEDSGKIVYLNSNIRKYTSGDYKYHIIQDSSVGETTKTILLDIDGYRNVLSSGYSVFKSKTSGKLAILAELIMVDSYSITHSIVPRGEKTFDVIIHTEVTPEITDDNHLIAPKLLYYYLENSLGYIHTTYSSGSSPKYQLVPLFKGGELNADIGELKLSEMFTGASTQALNIVNTWGENTLNINDFDFPVLNTYHGNFLQITKPNSFQGGLYYKNGNDEYVLVDEDTFNASSVVYAWNFLPEKENTNDTVYKYKDFKLASLKLPQELYDNELDLPFKYDYKLVPCMNYGRLQHLAVSNSVDFSKLRSFNLSKFNVWKYRIDGSLLRLTFGAEIYDTYESDKVDGLFFEFYDLRGFAGSLEITDKRSYSGVFTKVITLNTLNALDKKRCNDVLELFKHNINIQELNRHADYAYVESSNSYVEAKYIHNESDNSYSDIDKFVIKQATNGAYVLNDNGEFVRGDGEIKYGVCAYTDWEGSWKNTILCYKPNDEEDKYKPVLLYACVKVDDGTGTHTAEGMPDESGSHVFVKATHNKEGENYILYFNFNNDEVVYDTNTGWNIADDLNDCGVLYSNVVYGVKAYFRQTTKDGVKTYTKKQDFFLFTLPIYNEFYYTVDNFDTLTDPKLEMTLTYNISNTDSRHLYTGNLITSGYSTHGKNIIDQYLNARYSESEFTVKKYYKFNGISTLHLDIGFKPEYADLNICSDLALGKYFTCDLLLVGDDGQKSFTATKDGLEISYSSELINVSDVYIGFGEDKTNKLTIENLSAYTFLSGKGSSDIKINYNFVLNYDINVSKISTGYQKVQTVCALCHEDNNGLYNYLDFGVNCDGEYYLSTCIVGCSGSSFGNHVRGLGIYKQTTSSSLTLKGDCITVAESSDSSTVIHTKGYAFKDLMGSMRGYVPKLAFCLPNCHGLPQYGLSGVNTNLAPGYGGIYCMPPNTDGITRMANTGKLVTDKSGTRFAQSSPPIYNMLMVTEGTLKGNHFYSMMDSVIAECSPFVWQDYKTYGLIPVKGRKFVGFDHDLLLTFNKKLLNTMKTVYAYNKNYDQMEILSGDVYVVNNDVKFTSNLVSLNSEINFPTNTTLNDFVFIGPILFSNYLQRLSDFSEIAIKDSNGILKKLTFVPDLTNCGTTEGYLLTTLTYNIETPSDVANDLDLKYSNPVVVRTHDRKLYIVLGDLDKKALYGFDEESKKLIQLVLGLYSINTEGFLHLGQCGDTYCTTLIRTDLFKNTNDGQIANVPSDYSIDANYNYSGEITRYEPVLWWSRIRGTSITIEDLIYKDDGDEFGHKLFLNPNNRVRYTGAEPGEKVPYLRNMIYYRTGKEGDSNAMYHASLYDGSPDYLHYNNLYLFTGPSFTTNNLY